MFSLCLNLSLQLAALYSSLHTGAMRRLAALLEARSHGHDHSAAALCGSLADGVDLAVSAALTHGSAAVRSAAIVFVGAFCRCCSPHLLQRVVKRDCAASEGQLELVARLVALAAQPHGSQGHNAAAAALRAIAHGLPAMQRVVLEKLVSAACSCEADDQAVATVTVLHGCLVPARAPPTAAIAPGAPLRLAPVPPTTAGARPGHRQVCRARVCGRSVFTRACVS